MTTAGNEYLFKRNLLREAAQASATGGTPVNDDAVMDYAAGKSAADADAALHAANLKLDAGKFMTNLLLAHRELADWGKQNDLSTLLAASTIPVQALSMKKQADSLDRQEATQKEIVDLEKKKVDLATAAIDRDRAYVNNTRPLTSREESAALAPTAEIAGLMDAADYAKNPTSLRNVARRTMTDRILNIAPRTTTGAAGLMTTQKPNYVTQ